MRVKLLGNAIPFLLAAHLLPQQVHAQVNQFTRQVDLPFESALSVQTGHETTAGDWINNFDYAQAEEQLAQGQRLMAGGDFLAAEKAYLSAVQFSRVNLGLHNRNQIVMVDHLLDALLAQSKWEEFDQRLAYLLWLNNVAFPDDPEGRAQGLIRISDWHRAAAASFSDSRNTWYLVKAKSLNWQAISLLEAQYGPNDLRLAPLLYRIAMDHYYLAVSTQRKGFSSYEFKTDDKTLVNGWSLSGNETINRSYRIGKELLSRIAALYADTEYVPKEAEGMNLIALADWELLFENGGAALEKYLAAAQSLETAGISTDAIDAFFGRPVILPERNFSVHWPEELDTVDQNIPVRFVAWSRSYPGAQRPEDIFERYVNSEAADQQQHARVELSLLNDFRGSDTQQVSARHFDYRVNSLTLIDLSPDDDGLAKRAALELPLLQFRPRISKGALDVHRLITLDYVFARN